MRLNAESGGCLLVDLRMWLAVRDVGGRQDELETRLPPANRYRVTDQQQTLQFHSGNNKLRNEYAARFTQRKDALDKLCREVKIRPQFVTTTMPLDGALG